MNTQENSQSQAARRVIVIGAGISGLAAAHETQRLARERGRAVTVTVLDAGAHAGGVIRTSHRDGFIVEQGPDCFVSNKPAGVELATSLGLEGEMTGIQAEYRRSFVVHHGTLKPLPEGFFLLAPTSIKALVKTPVVSWCGKARMAMELCKPARRSDGDESLASFVTRRFGREALERVAQPMVAGIYTADPERLSLRATFPNFLGMERAHGSVTRALMRQGAGSHPAPGANSGAAQASGPRYGLFVSFKQGMSTLIDALVRAIGAANIRLNTRVEAVKPVSGENKNVPALAGPGARKVLLASGEILVADTVVVALPAQAAARVLRLAAPRLADALQMVDYASSAIVNLAVREDQVAHPLNGAGFVAPQVENRRILACSFSHRKFAGRAPQGSALLRVFVGGALRPDLAALDDESLVALAREELATLIGLSGEPLFSTVTRWRESMPQYDVGHLARAAHIREAEAATAGIVLTGNAFDGIGIPDCIRNARAAAQRTVGA